MDNAICIGCGTLIDTQIASEQEGLCLTCYGVANAQQWYNGVTGPDRETVFLERCFFTPPRDPLELDGKLDQLIEMTQAMQKELETIHTALKRYEAHHREKHHGS